MNRTFRLLHAAGAWLAGFAFAVVLLVGMLAGTTNVAAAQQTDPVLPGDRVENGRVENDRVENDRVAVTGVERRAVQSQLAQDQSAQESDNSLTTSNAQVRRALIGLLSVAVLTLLVGIAYWFFSGAEAKRRFALDYPNAVVPERRTLFSRRSEGTVVGARERQPGDGQGTAAASPPRRGPRAPGQRRSAAATDPSVRAPVVRSPAPPSRGVSPVRSVDPSRAQPPSTAPQQDPFAEGGLFGDPTPLQSDADASHLIWAEDDNQNLAGEQDAGQPGGKHSSGAPAESPQGMVGRGWPPAQPSRGRREAPPRAANDAELWDWDDDESSRSMRHRSDDAEDDLFET